MKGAKVFIVSVIMGSYDEAFILKIFEDVNDAKDYLAGDEIIDDIAKKSDYFDRDSEFNDHLDDFGMVRILEDYVDFGNTIILHIQEFEVV